MRAGASQKIPARAIIVIALFLILAFSFVCFVSYNLVSPLFASRHFSPPATNVTAGPPVWRPKLTGIPFPDTPAAGKFRGASFSVAHAVYSDKKLSLRDGSGNDSRYFVINLNLSGDALPGVSYDLSSSGTTGLPDVKMNWHENGSQTTTSRLFAGGYALKLKFGNRNKNNIPAKIYLCLPDDQKSYVAGTLNVVIRKEKDSTASAEN